jgi:hypothetical protein
MCYLCGSPEALARGYSRCPSSSRPQSNAARLRKKTARTYRRDLARHIFEATGDAALATKVRNSSISAMPEITAAVGMDPDAVSDVADMPTTGSRNHAIPADDRTLIRQLKKRVKAGEVEVPDELSTDGVTSPDREDASVEEVVAKINDPEFTARSNELRQQWREVEAHRDEVDATAKATVADATDAMTGAQHIPTDLTESGACPAGQVGYDPETGQITWSPTTDADLTTPESRVAVARALLAGSAAANGVMENVGKVDRKTQNALKALEPDGADALGRLKSGDMSAEEATALADRLRAAGESVAPEEGKKWTRKLEGERDRLLAAADDLDRAVAERGYVAPDITDIYRNPDNIDALYDFDPQTLTTGLPEGADTVGLTREQAEQTAAALLLGASNDASDARQDAALDNYLARCRYEAEEDRMAAELVEMIPSGNANGDYKHLGLGEAEMLAVTEEGSADWLNARNTGIGGSEMLEAMGVKPSVRKTGKNAGELSEMNDRSKAFWLAEAAEKKAHTFTEDEADHSTKGAAARGHAWEPAMRAAYSAEHDDVDVVCGKQTWKGKDGEDSYQTLNVDGIICDKKTGKPVGLLECKNSDVPEKWTDGVPIGYRAQVLSYLDATDLEYADLVARVDGEMTTYRIHKDDPVSGVEGTKTFADYKPTIEANWAKIKEARPALQAAETEARAAGKSEAEVAAVVAQANPYSPPTRRPIGDSFYDISTAAKNMEGLGLGDQDSLKAELNAAKDSGGSVDSAVRSIIADRFDREKMGRAVGIDGETATIIPAEDGFSDPRGFSPLYSDWIESGFVYQDPDGSKSDKISIMHGADQRILDHNGTGAEAVHHISPEMIADEPRLQDRETRKRVHKALVDGDVIVAHNVNFEQKHLFHHMPALKQSTKWLDTAWLARHFMPAEVDGVKRNGKLETFSEDNGVPYVNAHRAAEDADMMIDAMTAFFGKKGWSDSPFTGE